MNKITLINYKNENELINKIYENYNNNTLYPQILLLKKHNILISFDLSFSEEVDIYDTIKLLSKYDKYYYDLLNLIDNGFNWIFDYDSIGKKINEDYGINSTDINFWTKKDLTNWVKRILNN